MLQVIEMFAGIGSQTQALQNIGVEHEVIGISEWEVNAIITYDAIHTNDGIDYTEKMSKKEVIDFLNNFTFSTDGKNPCDIKKLNEKTLRNLYNAHKRSKNLGSILDIEKLEYADLWTYSFPCQDISIAGKQEGIKEGTRSGLLYEVERLLEVSEKPKYLLLENVKNLVGKGHKADFDKWLNKLEEIGYKNYWQVLNAKNYGIPQKRERVFVVSVRKDLEQDYIFPQGFDNGLRLKDFLEDEVDEKYYLSKKMIDYVSSSGTGGFNYKPEFNPEIAKPITASVSKMQRAGCANYIKEPKILCGKGMNGNVFSEKGLSPTLTTNKGEGLKVQTDFRIRKLTPKECWRLMGFKDEQFNKAQAVNSDSQLYKQAGNSIVVNVLEVIFKNIFLP